VTLLHIIDRDDWQKAVSSRTTYSSPGQDELGFMHLSTPELVLIPANSFYAGQTNLVLLVIDESGMGPELVWEAGVPPVGDSLFPHLYGPLEVDAVVDVVDFPCNEDGGFELPPSLEK
jgi:uncharacterized protein (DUF952 family)